MAVTDGRTVVRVLALPESSPAVVYGLYEILHAAGTAWSELTGEPASVAPLDVRIAGRALQMPSFLGIPIHPQEHLSEVPAPSVVIACDINMPTDTDPRGRWHEEVQWLTRCHAAGAIVCSACSGSLLLADAGLLDGLEATTHWMARDLFARYYPAVRLNAAHVLLPAGPEQRIVTSGGAASWEDLALYVAARCCGQEEARRLARLFVLGDRSDGQLPFATPLPRKHDDGAVAACERWIRQHFAEAHPVAGMVRQSRLPERTFKRRFRGATGVTPLGYVHALRIEAAKQRLEVSNDPTDDVAAAVGYEDPAFFRRLFRRHTGVTPLRYRRRFQRVACD